MGGGSGRTVFVRHQQSKAYAVITGPSSEEEEALGVRVPCLRPAVIVGTSVPLVPRHPLGPGQRAITEAPTPEHPASWQLWSEDVPPGQALGLVTHRA